MTFTKLGSGARKNKLTSLNGIFFGVGSVILQVDTNCLRYGAPCF